MDQIDGSVIVCEVERIKLALGGNCQSHHDTTGARPVRASSEFVVVTPGLRECEAMPLRARLWEDPSRRNHWCVCDELELFGFGDAPVIDLCRKIVATENVSSGVADGVLEVYRGQTLALTVKSISALAAQRIGSDTQGKPRFMRDEKYQPPRKRMLRAAE